jgi:hypothetical protein
MQQNRPDADPRLAHTGLEVLGRELIDNQVLLSDFERFLEIGEANEQARAGGEDPDDGQDMALWELLGFIDRHGRQLLELAKLGAGTLAE